MVHTLSLRKNFSWTFIGNLSYAGSQWLILVVLAKLGNPEMVGCFALAMSITSPIILFCNLAIRETYVTDQHNDYEFKDYLSIRVITSAIAILVTLMVSVYRGYDFMTSISIVLFSGFRALEAISDIFYGLFQKYERMDWIAQSMILKSCLNIAFLSVSIYLSQMLWAGLLGMFLAILMILFAYDLRTALYLSHAKGITLNLRWKYLDFLKICWITLPLGITISLVSFNTNLPRYIIEEHLGKAQLGIFAGVASFMLLGNTVMAA